MEVLPGHEVRVGYGQRGEFIPELLTFTGHPVGIADQQFIKEVDAGRTAIRPKTFDHVSRDGHVVGGIERHEADRDGRGQHRGIGRWIGGDVPFEPVVAGQAIDQHIARRVDRAAHRMDRRDATGKRRVGRQSVLDVGPRPEGDDDRGLWAFGDRAREDGGNVLRRIGHRLGWDLHAVAAVRGDPPVVRERPAVGPGVLPPARYRDPGDAELFEQVRGVAHPRRTMDQPRGADEDRPNVDPRLSQEDGQRNDVTRVEVDIHDDRTRRGSSRPGTRVAGRRAR